MMKKEYNLKSNFQIKRIVLTVLLLIVCCFFTKITFAANIGNYYTTPFGTFDYLQLYPITAPICEDGSFFADANDNNEVKGCFDGSFLPLITSQWDYDDATLSAYPLNINANVGLGTTDPLAPLHIKFDPNNIPSENDGLLLNNNLNINDYLSITVGSSTTVDAGLYFENQNTSNHGLTFKTNTISEPLRLLNSGQISLGDQDLSSPATLNQTIVNIKQTEPEAIKIKNSTNSGIALGIDVNEKGFIRHLDSGANAKDIILENNAVASQIYIAADDRIGLDVANPTSVGLDINGNVLLTETTGNVPEILSRENLADLTKSKPIYANATPLIFRQNVNDNSTQNNLAITSPDGTSIINYNSSESKDIIEFKPPGQTDAMFFVDESSVKVNSWSNTDNLDTTMADLYIDGDLRIFGELIGADDKPIVPPAIDYGVSDPCDRIKNCTIPLTPNTFIADPTCVVTLENNANPGSYQKSFSIFVIDTSPTELTIFHRGQNSSKVHYICME